MYIIEVIKTAEKQLDALQEKQFQRIDDAILKLSTNPRPGGCKKLKGERDIWRIRVGTYRVLYRLDDNRKLVTILGVRHRSEAYRGL